MSITVSILGLAVLILIHEAGHFFAARAVGMRPRRFYLGFPPALVKVNRGGVEYGIGAIPFGGYVKIPGMHRPAPGDLRASLKPDDQDALSGELDALDDALEHGDETSAKAALPALEPRLHGQRMFEELKDQLSADAYWRQATWKRVVVIAAGPFVNAVCALLLFLALYMTSVQVGTQTIDKVIAGHPAAAAGLKADDTIVRIAGRRATAKTLPTRINATHGRRFTIVVDREGKLKDLGPLRAVRGTDGVYRVGIQLKGVAGPGQPLPTAAWSSIRLTGVIISDEAKGIAGLFVGHGTGQVSSTVGIVRDTAAAYRISVEDYLSTIGFISLVLAILNLLPLLPLDGGHIVMSLLEAIRRRAFSQIAYLRFSAVGVAVLLFLVSLGLNNDLPKLG